MRGSKIHRQMYALIVWLEAQEKNDPRNRSQFHQQREFKGIKRIWARPSENPRRVRKNALAKQYGAKPERTHQQIVTEAFMELPEALRKAPPHNF